MAVGQAYRYKCHTQNKEMQEQRPELPAVTVTEYACKFREEVNCYRDQSSNGRLGSELFTTKKRSGDC